MLYYGTYLDGTPELKNIIMVSFEESSAVLVVNL